MTFTINMFISKPWLRAFSGLFINLSALWFSLAFITPNFTSLNKLDALAILTGDIVSAILSLVSTVKIEEFLDYESLKKELDALRDIFHGLFPEEKERFDEWQKIQERQLIKALTKELFPTKLKGEVQDSTIKELAEIKDSLRRAKKEGRIETGSLKNR